MPNISIIGQQVNYYKISLVVSLFCLVLKFNADYGSATSMKWMLGPLSFIVGLLSGLHFEFNPLVGYVNHSGNVILGTTCAGINFMIILIMASAFTFLPKLSFKEQFVCAPFLIIIAWIFSLFVNASRVSIAIKLISWQRYVHALGTDKAHEALGVFYYLFFLMLYYFIVQKLITNHLIKKP